MNILRSAFIYFALVFAVAFAMGVVRTFYVAPWIGTVIAVLLEIPLVLAAAWVLCGYVLRRWPVPPDVSSRAAMGANAFILLMIAEALISIFLGGLSLSQHLAIYTTPTGWLGLLGQIPYTLFPLVRERTPVRR